MNYIELINRAWCLREQGLLTMRDHDLYSYLVHKCNALRWQNPFRQSTSVICATLTMKVEVLCDRRKHLQELGLIKFTAGVSRACLAEYEICVPYVPKKAKEMMKDIVKPTIENIAGYCKQKEYQVDASRFFEFYEAKGWKTGKRKVENWKALVDLWQSNNGLRKNNFAKHKNGVDYGKF